MTKHQILICFCIVDLRSLFQVVAMRSKVSNPHYKGENQAFIN